MNDPLIHVVSNEQAEQADFVVCCRKGTPKPFLDNVEGECAECGYPVIFRPHSPKTPPRICIECVMDHLAAGAGANVGSA